jgi:hypothetical protein
MGFKKCFQIVPNVERFLEYGLVYALYQMFQEDVKKNKLIKFNKCQSLIPIIKTSALTFI